MLLTSTLTCPKCGHQSTDTMPTDACQFFYDCKGCAAVLRPNAQGLLRLLLVRGRAMPPDSGGARVRINGELLHLIASGDQHLSAIYTRSREEAHARNL